MTIILQMTFSNEFSWITFGCILIKISLKLVSEELINNNAANDMLNIFIKIIDLMIQLQTVQLLCLTSMMSVRGSENPCVMLNKWNNDFWT